MHNVYKFNCKELTEQDIDIIVIALCHFKAVCLKEKVMDKKLELTDKLLDKILRKL